MAEYTYDILAEGIEQGTTGQPGDQPQPARVRNIGFTEMHDFATSVTLTVTASTAKTVQVCFQGYSSANSNDIICNLSWYNSPHTFDLSSYSGIKYFRVVIRYSDSSNITPSEITSATLVESYPPAWQIEDDIFTHEVLPTMIPMLVQPYPPGVWWIENDTFEQILLPTMIPLLVQPYPPGIWYIDNNEFKNLLMPDSIMVGAFNNCTSLASITIPNSVNSIGSNAFADCASLTSITINKPKGSISGAPWGATNDVIQWVG